MKNITKETFANVKLVHNYTNNIIIAFLILTLTASAVSAATLDNTKNVAVYLDNTSSIAHDPFCTAMFFEYNLDYLTKSSISAENLSNVDLLLVPTQYLNNTTVATINNWIGTGGKVWFFADPRFNETTQFATVNRFTFFGNVSGAGDATEYTVNAAQVLTVENNDSITAFMPSGSVTALTTTAKTTYMRKYNVNTGTTDSGFNYHVLIYKTSADQDMLIKYQNNTTGAKVLYSNADMFISGGQTNYFDRSTATHLFLNCKEYMLGTDDNTKQVQVTYPKSDKIFTITLDDMLGNLSNEEPRTAAYFEMKDTFGYPIPDTFFMNPGSGSVKEGFEYYEQYGDTHTLHPHHGLNWSAQDYTVGQAQTNLSELEAQVNTMNEVSDYGFYTFRFPGTFGNAEAFKAFDNLGYSISSNYGPYTHMGAVGNTLTNNIWFPKQKILFSEETGMIEIEAPTKYDIDLATADLFYVDQATRFPYFFNVNFPSNYVVGGHIQCMMEQTDLRDNTTKFLTYLDQNSSYVAFESLDTIAHYNDAVEKATITATESGDTVTVTVVAVDPIDNFTVKISNMSNCISATYDGAALGIDHARYEDDQWFVFHDVSAGTHTITVTQVSSPEIYSTYIGKNGNAGKVATSVETVKSNAGGLVSHVFTESVIYDSGVNVVTESENTLVLARQETADSTGMVVTTSTGTVNVTVSQWGDELKVFNESSDSHSAVTTHVIGGFAANERVSIFRDGIELESGSANSAGVLTWIYEGGFSEHEFMIRSTTVSEVISSDTKVTTSRALQGAVGLIAAAVLIAFSIPVVQGLRSGRRLEASEVISLSGGLIGLSVILILGAAVLGAF